MPIRFLCSDNGKKFLHVYFCPVSIGTPKLAFYWFFGKNIMKYKNAQSSALKSPEVVLNLWAYVDEA